MAVDGPTELSSRLERRVQLHSILSKLAFFDRLIWTALAENQIGYAFDSFSH
jgi:hypothetical protein